MIHTLRRGEIHHARAEQVYPTLEAGSVSLAIIDGPYNMRKAEWDKFRSWADFVDWYRPHIEAWGRICAPSATVYVWGNDEGEAYLREPMRAAGWTFRGRITWDKGVASITSYHARPEDWRSWKEQAEYCGMYVRNEWEIDTCAGQQIAYAAGADEKNWIRQWLCDEWDATGLRKREADTALGTNGMAGHYFGASQWSLPTWENYQTLAAYAQRHGAHRERPYLVHPSVWPDGGLRAEYDHLRASYDHLRASYEAARYPFKHPMGVGNVWRHGQVQGAERLRSEKGDALHPCQKPLAFYERMIRASSRPGDLVLEPFGGTCRAAVAIERLPAAEARRYVCIEPDEDGRDYLGAVLRSLRFDPGEEKGAQVGLFGGAS